MLHAIFHSSMSVVLLCGSAAAASWILHSNIRILDELQTSQQSRLLVFALLADVMRSQQAPAQ
jgi:hypothetical protein